jgi:uncharacterized protein with von Willebrand factor type A (vWA) domain
MFILFFLELRAAKVPASLREFLTLPEAMRASAARHGEGAFHAR